MSFIIYDLTLLAVFLIFLSIFLYKKRKNLKKEGILFLYKTSWGIKLINSVGSRYKKTLKFFSYMSIITGYILMIGIFYLIIQTVYIYLTTPIVKIIKVPPIAPLIPYFPKLFGLQSFFPPFYFLYFIIAILIVASVHEFSHGIFAKRYKIKIKSTGIAFLRFFPVFFGAFVEQDEENMKKAKKFEQMSVLSAGVFTNIVVMILFYIILFWFFTSFFIASGVVFNDYSYAVLPITSITSINGITVEKPVTIEKISELTKDSEKNMIEANGKNFIGIKSISDDGKQIALYDDAPAINAELIGAITEINSVKIDSLEKLSSELGKYNVGDKVIVKTLSENDKNKKQIKEYELELVENPQKPGKAMLGIGFIDQSGGFLAKIMGLFPSYKKPHIYYEERNSVSLFIKDLLWWIVIINLLVAFFNMLPLGILDGGRFFYLTMLGLTKSEKIANKSFSFITYIIILLFIILMIKWFFGLF